MLLTIIKNINSSEFFKEKALPEVEDEYLKNSIYAEKVYDEPSPVQKQVKTAK